MPEPPDAVVPVVPPPPVVPPMGMPPLPEPPLPAVPPVPEPPLPPDALPPLPPDELPPLPPDALPPLPPDELPPLPPDELPPLPSDELPPAPPDELPPLPPDELPPEPALPPDSAPSKQEPKLAQSPVRHALSAFSASDRAEPVLDCSEVLTTFLHWAAVIPERELQVSAFLQTSPARSLPPPPQLAAPTATSPTTIKVHRVFSIVDSSQGVSAVCWGSRARTQAGAVYRVTFGCRRVPEFFLPTAYHPPPP